MCLVVAYRLTNTAQMNEPKLGMLKFYQSKSAEKRPGTARIFEKNIYYFFIILLMVFISISSLKM